MRIGLLIFAFQFLLLVDLYSQEIKNINFPLLFPYQVDYNSGFGIVNDKGDIIREPDYSIFIVGAYLYPNEFFGYLTIEKQFKGNWQKCFIDRNGEYIIDSTFYTFPMRRSDFYGVYDSIERLGIYDMYSRRWICPLSSNKDSIHLLIESIDSDWLQPPKTPTDKLTYEFLDSTKEILIKIRRVASEDEEIRHKLITFNEYCVIKPIYNKNTIIDYLIVLQDYTVLNSALKIIIPSNYKVSSLKIIEQFIVFLIIDGNEAKANLYSYKGEFLADFLNINLERAYGYESQGIFFKAVAFGKEFYVNNNGYTYLPKDIKIKWKLKN